MTFRRKLFFQKKTIVDIFQGPKYVSMLSNARY